MMELLTVREVAAYLKTTRQQVRRMIQCGELRAVKVGGSTASPWPPWRSSWRSSTATIQQSTPARMTILAGDFFWLSACLISFFSVQNSLKSFHKIDDNGKERAVLHQKERISDC